MIDIDNEISVIMELLKDDDPRHIRYAALECRLSIEKICYERLRLAHKYISFDKVRDWQPPKLLRFLFQEVEPSLLGGSRISISRMPKDVVGEISREHYEAMDWVELGEQALLDIKKITELYYKISKHLHANMPSDDHCNDVGDCGEMKRHVKQVVDELTIFSKGNIEFFHPTPVVSFQCLCGEDIRRTEHSLQNAQTITCLSSTCRITYVPKLTEQQYELCRRTATINCPHCDHEIRQDFADLEQLSIGSEHSTKCPNCKGGLKLHPGFYVLKHDF